MFLGVSGAVLFNIHSKLGKEVLLAPLHRWVNWEIPRLLRVTDLISNRTEYSPLGLSNSENHTFSIIKSSPPAEPCYIVALHIIHCRTGSPNSTVRCVIFSHFTDMEPEAQRGLYLAQSWPTPLYPVKVTLRHPHSSVGQADLSHFITRIKYICFSMLTLFA